MNDDFLGNYLMIIILDLLRFFIFILNKICRKYLKKSQ